MDVNTLLHLLEALTSKVEDDLPSITGGVGGGYVDAVRIVLSEVEYELLDAGAVAAVLINADAADGVALTVVGTLEEAVSAIEVAPMGV